MINKCKLNTNYQEKSLSLERVKQITKQNSKNSNEKPTLSLIKGSINNEELIMLIKIHMQFIHYNPLNPYLKIS